MQLTGKLIMMKTVIMTATNTTITMSTRIPQGSTGFTGLWSIITITQILTTGGITITMTHITPTTMDHPITA